MLSTHCRLLTRRCFGTHVWARQAYASQFIVRQVVENPHVYTDSMCRREMMPSSNVQKTVDGLLRLHEFYRREVNKVNALRRVRREVADRIKVLQTKKTTSDLIDSEPSPPPSPATPPTAADDEMNTAHYKAILSATDLEPLYKLGRELKEDVAAAEKKLAGTIDSLDREALNLPNIIAPSVPNEIEVVHTEGTKPVFEWGQPRDHVDLAEMHDWVDFERAAAVSGNRFYFLKGALALLELALSQYAMQRCAARGYMPMTTPDMVYRRVAEGAGYLPRSEASQLYVIQPPREHEHLDDGLKKCMVGTAEIPLAGMYSGQVLAKQNLPIKMVALSHCFRHEVGSGGTDKRGLYRVHQFTKVELFAITHPSESDAALEEIVQLQRELFSDLGLHYQVLNMPAPELGASAYRKYDIEAWMPGRNGYGEISSASNCTDYQSRRLNIRYRDKPHDPMDFVHTVNGTACAIPRMILALLETNQRQDGSIILPKALKPYLVGLPDVLHPPTRRSSSIRV